MSERTPQLVTPNEILNAEFDSRLLGFGGYKEEQVDDLLEDAAYTISVLIELCRPFQDAILE